MTSDRQATDGDPADQPDRDLSHRVLPDGGVRARVANLAGLQVDASNERQALSRIVPAFKQRVSEFMNAQSAIPWIEPPLDPEPAEQTRFIPVHL